MPVRHLAPNPDLDHLKHQARDLLNARDAGQDLQAVQRIREFHPLHHKSTDAQIFKMPMRLNDAQLVIAREHGFPTWAALKKHIEKPKPSADQKLSFYDRIEDQRFLQALRLLDAGETRRLSDHLKMYPAVVRQRLDFEGRNYFRNPTLLEFVAENPVRNGTLPSNIIEVGKVILDAGAGEDKRALNATLGLVCSGRVTRETGHQLPLIDLLVAYGAEPTQAFRDALGNGEFQAAEHLIRHGAVVDLSSAAAMDRTEEAGLLLPSASSEDRHRALAMASQFGHVEIVRLLLSAGEDPSRFNPLGTHSHSTPLHQAALAGHDEVVRLLVESGARLDLRDTLWQGTPADWAEHAQNSGMEAYLRAQEERQRSGAVKAVP